MCYRNELPVHDGSVYHGPFAAFECDWLTYGTT